jgi:REP element-mobilizing transposase RayT
MTLNHKTARLPSRDYLGRQTCFLTICCDHRSPYLAAPPTARLVLCLLLECAASNSFLLHAFCLMPDHLHILAEGVHDRCDVLEFIRLFKQRTAFQFRKSYRRALWEMSYHDHILRHSESIENVAVYIWWNPVRKQLCDYPHKFPYSGSQTIDWIKRAASPTSWSPPWKVVAGL